MRCARLYILMALLPMVPVTVWAQSASINPALESKFLIHAGGYFQNVDASFRSTKPPRPDIEVDIDDLNIDDYYTSPFFEFRWLFAERWSEGPLAGRRARSSR